MFDVDDTSLNINSVSEVLQENLVLWSNTTRDIIVIYLVFLLLLGLVGNLVALLGSIFHHAIKTDKISVVFLRDLAITDILLTIFLYIPMLSTLIADKWVLGKTLCLVTHVAYEILLLNKIVVIAMISIYRLWLIKKPPSVKRSLSQNKFILLCFVVPFICFLPQLIIEALFDEAKSYFEPARFLCYSWNFYHDSGRALESLLILFPFLVVPIFIIIIANVRLIVVLVSQARKCKRGFKNRRLFICIKFIRLVIVITYMPNILFIMFQAFSADSSEKLAAYLNFINLVAPLNCAASPIIYVLANKNFRQYLITCGGRLDNDHWRSYFTGVQRQTLEMEMEPERSPMGETKM